MHPGFGLLPVRHHFFSFVVKALLRRTHAGFVYRLLVNTLLNDFSADPKYCAGKLPVASDAKGEIAKSYDIKVTENYNGHPIAAMKDSRGIEIGHAPAERTTFIVTPDDKIVATIGGLGGDANAEKALEVVQDLTAKRTAKN